MQLQFHTLDVFTETRFGGNPLAVVLDAGALTPEQMQTIARELNLSETVFVLPAENPAHSARMRIFTPLKEIPFAGHPTVGTATLLAELRLHSAGVEQDSLSCSSRHAARYASVFVSAPATLRSPNSTRHACQRRQVYCRRSTNSPQLSV